MTVKQVSVASQSEAKPDGTPSRSQATSRRTSRRAGRCVRLLVGDAVDLACRLELRTSFVGELEQLFGKSCFMELPSALASCFFLSVSLTQSVEVASNRRRRHGSRKLQAGASISPDGRGDIDASERVGRPGSSCTRGAAERLHWPASKLLVAKPDPPRATGAMPSMALMVVITISLSIGHQGQV